MQTLKKYIASIATLHEPPVHVGRTKSIYLVDDDFNIISTGIGKNKEFFQKYLTPENSYIPVYTAAQAPVAFIPVQKTRSPLRHPPSTQFYLLRQMVMGQQERISFYTQSLFISTWTALLYHASTKIYPLNM